MELRRKEFAILVLTRQPGERVVIAEQVYVTVLAIEGGRVRLGFEAPKLINIRREELPAWKGAVTTPEGKE